MSKNDCKPTAPAVSVIVPTYRRPHLLPRALNSLLNQTFTDFELIVVDDGSGDETAEVVAGFVDPRLRYICLETNGGVANARNQAVERAQGEWLVFVDDDDRVEPTFLAELVDLISHAPPTVGFVWSWKSIVELTATGERVIRVETYRVVSPQPIPGADLPHRPRGGSSGLVVRRRVFEEMGGFDPAFYSVDDTDLLLRMAVNYDYAVCPRPLYFLTKMDGPQLTDLSEKKGRSLELLIERHAHRIGPGTLRSWRMSAARNYFASGKRAEGRRVMSQLIRARPTSARSWILWAAFELAPWLPGPLRRRIFRPHR